MKLQLPRITSLLLTGLIAGTFFYGTYCVLPTFYEVSSETHLHFRTALMIHNRVIVMVLVLMALFANSMYILAVSKIKIVRTFCIIALIFTIISLVITRLGSVPINMQIKTWVPAALPADYRNILNTWDSYNLIRTISSIGSFVSLLIADIWLFNRKI